MEYKTNILPIFSQADWAFESATFNAGQVLTVQPTGKATTVLGGANIDLKVDYTPESYKLMYNSSLTPIDVAFLRIRLILSDNSERRYFCVIKNGLNTHIVKLQESNIIQLEYQVWNRGTSNLTIQDLGLYPSEGVASLVNNLNKSVENLGKTVVQQGTQISANSEAIDLKASKSDVTEVVYGVLENTPKQFPNLLINTDFRFYGEKLTPLWDAGLNGTLEAEMWSDYNPSVVNPTTGYHAHLDDKKFAFKTFNLTCADITRWIGTKQVMPTGSLKANATYTFGIMAYTTTPGTSLTFSLEYKLADGTTQSSSETLILNEDNVWNRLVYTPVTIHADINVTLSPTVIITAYNTLGTIYIYHGQLEPGFTVSDWSCAVGDLDKYVQHLHEQTAQINIDVNNISLGVTTLEQKTVEIDAEIAKSLTYRIDLISSNGNIFKNGNIATTLEAKIYKANDDISELIPAERIIWKRKSMFSASDDYWNSQHLEIGRIIQITRDDVEEHATFTCELDL